MIADALLKKSAAESCVFYADSLEYLASYAPKHNFSLEFESKIQKLGRKARNNINYRIIMRAACIILAFLFGSGVWLAFDVQARKAIGGWIKKTVGAYTQYELKNDTNKSLADGVKYYELTYIPEGYVFDPEYSQQTGASAYITYVCEDCDKLLRFDYKRFYADDLYMDTSGEIMQKIMVNNRPADYYTSADGQGASTIVWGVDETLFIVSGYFDKDELIRIANSVKTSDKPILQK